MTPSSATHPHFTRSTPTMSQLRRVLRHPTTITRLARPLRAQPIARAFPARHPCRAPATLPFASLAKAAWPSRSYSIQNVQRTYTVNDMTPSEYHKLSDETMDQMVEIIERLGEETDLQGFDLEYTQGVLTLKLGSHGTYVLNKQPPNKQIWLSSPKSGPKRYDYDIQHGKWFYPRDNHTIDELMNAELSEIFGTEVKLLK